MAGIYVPGDLTYVSETLINPYTGHELIIDGNYYVNNSIIVGDEDEGDFVFGSVFDQYWYIENNSGDVMFVNILQFYSAPGNDIIILSSEDTVVGDLTIQVSEGDDIVWANAGDDIIGGQSGNDFLHGGPGNDDISGDEGDDLLIGASGDDTIDGGSGDDEIDGGEGSDIIYGGLGNDILVGGAGGTITLDKVFVDDIAFPELKERVNIQDLEPPGDPSLGVNDGNLDIDFDTTAEITFRKGFAGYNNSLGVYRIAEDGTIEMASLLWENVKDAGINQTHIVDLPLGEDGGEIGFFIIANGDRKNNYNNLDTDEGGNIRFMYDYGGANERDATVFDSGSDITVVYDDGVTQQVLKGHAYHTTARDGASDLNADGEVHVVTGLAEVGNDDVLRVGFEDLTNLGDADFEDVLFDVNIVAQTVHIGEDGDDFLDGGAGDDMLYGGAGDDILIFGDGEDGLTGGSGADVFALTLIDEFIDTLSDFDASEGDVINITDVLIGYDALTDAITDFVSFADNNGNTEVLINADGVGDDHQVVFVVEGGVGATVDDMFNSGALIADQSVI